MKLHSLSAGEVSGIPSVAVKCVAKPTVGEGDKLKIVFTNDYDMGAVAREERLTDLKKSLAALTGKDVEVELELTDKNKAGKMIDITQFIKNMPIEYTDSEE